VPEFTTTLVEALGNLARWRLTPGQAADVTEAEPLLEGVAADAAAAAAAADKAYDSRSLVDTIAASGGQVVIECNANQFLEARLPEE
jgi:hypothetical protein